MRFSRAFQFLRFAALVAAATLSAALPSSAWAGKCTYNGVSYSTPRLACAALLAKQNPSETVKLADLDDQSGNVHCVGNPSSEGATAFDMWQNGVSCSTGSQAEEAVQPASEPASQTTTAGGNPNDRCLAGPAKTKTGDVNPPDPSNCPLSYRAWQIRSELGKRKIGAFAGAI